MKICIQLILLAPSQISCNCDKDEFFYFRWPKITTTTARHGEQILSKLVFWFFVVFVFDWEDEDWTPIGFLAFVVMVFDWEARIEPRYWFFTLCCIGFWLSEDRTPIGFLLFVVLVFIERGEDWTPIVFLLFVVLVFDWEAMNPDCFFLCCIVLFFLYVVLFLLKGEDWTPIVFSFVVLFFIEWRRLNYNKRIYSRYQSCNVLKLIVHAHGRLITSSNPYVHIHTF